MSQRPREATYSLMRSCSAPAPLESQEEPWDPRVWIPYGSGPREPPWDPRVHPRTPGGEPPYICDFYQFDIYQFESYQFDLYPTDLYTSDLYPTDLYPTDLHPTFFN